MKRWIQRLRRWQQSRRHTGGTGNGSERERQLRVIRRAATRESWIAQLRRKRRENKGKPERPLSPDDE